MNYHRVLALTALIGVLIITLTGCSVTEFFDVFSPNVDTPPPSITVTPTPIPTATPTPTPSPSPTPYSSCGCNGICPYSY